MSAAERISVSEFKARCLTLFENVHKKGNEVIVTKRGESIARVMPFQKPRKTRLGALKDHIKIQGNIVSYDSSEDWEVLAT